jgi:hypothetical protein
MTCKGLSSCTERTKTRLLTTYVYTLYRRAAKGHNMMNLHGINDFDIFLGVYMNISGWAANTTGGPAWGSPSRV